jgi:predicted  nucleic acid-binding Zn-ribbon protein
MCNGRDTEDELAKVADERDDAKKEREEVRWQARQVEKRAAAAEEALDTVRQVRRVWLGQAAVVCA